MATGKIGRGKRSTANKRYNTGRRDLTNKFHNVAKHEATIAHKKANPPKIPRGTARMLKRHPQTIVIPSNPIQV